MNLPITINQNELLDILLNIATVRPVFIWGAPGIGKSALVETFANDIGLPCVSLLGSQLAPEDIIGIPQIKDDVSVFLPPKMIARKEPYVLFLDELNACSQEVQKAFYSLIHERRIGEYHLPEGSIIIGAGNRSWHMLSDSLKEFNAGTKEIDNNILKTLVYACLTPAHAGMFMAYTKNIKNKDMLDKIIAKEAIWPDAPKDRDILYFLAQSFRAKLIQDLPKNKQDISGGMLAFVYRAKAMIKELSSINFELAQMTVGSDNIEALPDWFMVEIIRDLPRLVKQK